MKPLAFCVQLAPSQYVWEHLAAMQERRYTAEARSVICSPALQQALRGPQVEEPWCCGKASAACSRCLAGESCCVLHLTNTRAAEYEEIQNLLEEKIISLS